MGKRDQRAACSRQQFEALNFQAACDQVPAYVQVPHDVQEGYVLYLIFRGYVRLLRNILTAMQQDIFPNACLLQLTMFNDEGK